MFPVTGLVFCGGGGRGAYQIGVWQALRERGLDKYTAAVSGASVGALNAALFACGDLPLAERVWTSLKRGDITDPAETAGRDKLGAELPRLRRPHYNDRPRQAVKGRDILAGRPGERDS